MWLQDHISVEFYRAFWDIIKKPLLNSYTESHNQEQLSESQNHAVLTLFYKKGNKKQLKNYRPISLTNVDYKIFAFVLANRLQKVIHKIVSPHQTAYIKGRYIGYNIRSVLDILEYTDKKQIPGLLLCLDFQKAFDSLEWNFMISVLEKFKFGPSFINSVKMLYSKPEAKIKLNGWLSSPIKQTRGIRQGCPISALLFILCTEIMASAIINNKDIKGIHIPNPLNNSCKEQKLSQYADDTSVVLANECQVFPTLDTIYAFSAVSGLCLNIEKTEALWLGSLKHNKNTPFGFNWPKTIRYLGIYIGYDTSETLKWNWTNKIELFQKTLDCWRTRDLTIYGRSIIIKTLALAKLTYSATMLPIPVEVYSLLNKKIDNFIWKGRKRRIKHQILYKPITEGGINLINIEAHFQALKASWVPRLLNHTNDAWTCIPQYYLNLFGPNLMILNFNFDNPVLFPEISKLPLFYQEIIISFNKAKGENKPINKTQFLNSTIWGNKHFIVNNRILYNKNWVKDGIIKMDHVITQQGQLQLDRLYNIIQNKSDFIFVQSKILKIIKQYKQIFTDEPNYVSTRVSDLDPTNIKSNNGPQVNILKEKTKFSTQT